MEEKGLVVISITDEDPALVDAFVVEYQVTHPVVILRTDELEKLIGVEGFPTSAVFSNGELSWTGHPSSASSAISAALKSADKGSIYPKALSKVRSLMREGKADSAYAEILKNEPKYDAETAAWATRVKTYIEEQAAAAFESAQALAGQGYLYRAISKVKAYAGAESPLPQAAAMQEWMAKIESETPELKKEMVGGELFEKAVAQEKALEFTEAFETYRSVTKKAKDTRIAANAETAMKAIHEGKKAGYSPSCENCDSKSHQACSKHAEKLKL